MRSTALFAAALVSAVAAMLVLVSVDAVPDGVAAADRPIALHVAALPLVAVLVGGSWLLAVARPLPSLGWSMVSLSWLLPALGSWSYPAARERVVLLATGPLLCAGAALLGQWHRSSGAARRGSTVAVVLAVAAGVVVAAGYDPFFDPGCRWTCQSAPSPLHHVLSARSSLGAGALLTVLAAGAAATVLADRRGAPDSIRLSAAGALVLIVGAEVVGWVRWGHPTAADTVDRLVTTAAAVVVVGVSVAELRSRTVRRAVRDVVARLGGEEAVPPAGGRVRAVQFAVPGSGRWVGADGGGVRADEAHAAVLSDDGGPAVRLVLDTHTDVTTVLSSLSPAARLSLMNARLRAAALARVHDIEASQRRIVETRDKERKRIHRDLHDGAQQRLVAVTMQLGSARAHAGTAAAAALVDSGARDVREALSALRSFSHGSLFEVLDTEGLPAALEDVVVSSPLRVDLDVRLGETPVAPAAQTAAVEAVTTALANVAFHAGVSAASVSVVVEDDELVAAIADVGKGGAVIGTALTTLADRVGALGGNLTLHSPPNGGTRLTVRLPCAP